MLIIIDDGMLDTPAAPLPEVAGDVRIWPISFSLPAPPVPRKGVMIDHRAAMNTLEDINERFGLNAQDRVFGCHH